MKRKTNVQIVKNYMERGSQGALNQAFVMEAIGRYAEQVAKDPEATRKAMEGGMIHPDAWIACAEEWKAATKD